MRSQITPALDNLETIMSAADMSLVNITRLSIYTTNVDADQEDQTAPRTVS